MGKKHKKKPKKKVIQPDDYYGNGIFEIARYGEVVSMRNNATPEQHQKIMEFYRTEYPNVKARIDNKVEEIRENISTADPLKLLKFTKDMTMLVQMNKLSEIDYSAEDNAIMRAQEYVQSVLVSSENHFNTTMSDEEQEKLYHKIIADIEDLYNEFLLFYTYWAADKRTSNEISDEDMHNIVDAQMLYLVRGDRYQIFELESLKRLLPPHDDVLTELFGMNAKQIIEGLENLRYSLSQGIGDAWMEMGDSFDKYIEAIDNEAAEEALINEKYDEINPLVNKVFGYALNDISQVTGWDLRLINSLSFSIGEYKSFFGGSEFSGWPIMALPIHKKPFIRIGEVSYGFDYHAVFDYFYRVTQKEIVRLKPDYTEKWNEYQNIASEEMVRELFLRLLPGATAYIGNYYPNTNSTKQMSENDLLIIYEDYLFVIEVKAGSFPQTPPIIDFEAHQKAYRKLAEEADSQCSRTIDYIRNHSPAIFYDRDKNQKFMIDNIAEFSEIYSFSVTVDNFNEFAARAEKLSFITLSSKTIVISYDDLLIYEKYFESPIYFLHFLKQRKVAIDIPQIAVRDELDHLGLYIKNNLYSITASEFPPEHTVDWYGFRKDLDDYFIKLFIPELEAIKPRQNIPLEISNIINFLAETNSPSKFELSHFLLDFSTDAKEGFCKNIQKVLHRQNELGHIVPVTAFGETRYCMFAVAPGINNMDMKRRSDYVYATLLSSESLPIMLIELEYDASENLIKAASKLCTYSDIPPNELDRLKELSVENAKSRVEYNLQNHAKIGRNDPCPCGSGKKYKKCCIKYESGSGLKNA